MDVDEYIKNCPFGDGLVPMKAKICEECKFDFGDKVLIKEELKIPLDIVISTINDAFTWSA